MNWSQACRGRRGGSKPNSSNLLEKVSASSTSFCTQWKQEEEDREEEDEDEKNKKKQHGEEEADE